MAVVAKNEVLGTSNRKLKFFLRLNTANYGQITAGQGAQSDWAAGMAADPTILEFQIFDTSTPALLASPNQVYPLTPGTRASVNLALAPTGHKIATGAYFAAFTMPNTVNVGCFQIRWYWKVAYYTQEFVYKQEFRVTT